MGKSTLYFVTLVTDSIFSRQLTVTQTAILVCLLLLLLPGLS